MTHLCVGKSTIIGSDNGLSPGRRQAIIWTNAGILLIEPVGTNFSEILIGIQIFSFTKMRLKMSSAKWRPFCLGLNVITASYSEVHRKHLGLHVYWSWSCKHLHVLQKFLMPSQYLYGPCKVDAWVKSMFPAWIITCPIKHAATQICLPGITSTWLKIWACLNVEPCLLLKNYHKISNIRRTKFQNLNVSHLVLQLSLPNPLKPGVK